MWMFLGIGAVLFALLNLIWAFKNNNSGSFNYASVFRFVSMSLTALTLCAFYSDEAGRVAVKDWGGLMDIMPAMSKILWVCTFASIIINSISIFMENKLIKIHKLK
ncbi:MAG: hypothetical protein IJ661_01225 [Lachnospiraceae bacterium]|nr:hypothetical protein [Lachnospiraceae bacterium]